MLKFRLAAFAAAICSLLLFFTQVQNRGIVQASEPQIDRAVLASNRHATRILLLGKDRAAELTDSILILSVSHESGDLRILQIPRDTYAAYTDRDYRKLNGAYARLGLGGIKQFFSQSLGVSVDYALAIDLDCVSALVDAVGGVEVEIPQEMVYNDPSQNLSISLPAGRRLLNGNEAEQFLRFRSGYANADLGRMDAQKEFLRAYAQSCQSVGVKELLRIVWTVLPSAETDLPIGEAIRLVRLLPTLEPEQIPMITAPGEAVQGNSGAWYYVLCRAGMIRAINEYLYPNAPITELEFDPARVFDRPDAAEFHKIYTSPDSISEDVPSISQRKESSTWKKRSVSPCLLLQTQLPRSLRMPFLTYSMPKRQRTSRCYT